MTEDSATPTLSDTGSVGFTDPDLIDTHTAIATAAAGNTLGGTLTLGSVSELATTADGSVGWTYNVANSATQYLAAGQTATESFDVAISDTHSSTAHQTVTVTVTGVNDAPTDIAYSGNASVAEHTAANTVLGSFSTTDVDVSDTHTYSILSGNTDNIFKIVGNQLVLNLSPELSPEVNKTYTLDIQTNDSHVGGTYHETLNVTVTNDPSDDVVMASLPSAFAGTGDPNDFDTAGPGAAASVTPTPTTAADIIQGTNGADVINANNGADFVYGYGGNDTINGENGQDTLYGQAGNDTITGGTQNDTIYGGSGDDTISGNAQNDDLYGGSGNDVIAGDANNDNIIGGYGADIP